MTLRICDAIDVQRAPALLYVSREDSGNSSAATADSLVESIKTAHLQSSLARKRESAAEAERKANRDRKRNVEERLRLEQATKRPKQESAKPTAAGKEAILHVSANDKRKVDRDLKRVPGSLADKRHEKDVPETMADSTESGKENEAEEILSQSPNAIEPKSEIGKKGSPAAEDQENDVDEDGDDLPEIFAAGPDSDEED
ncbi:MAG: hypothetical protein SGILL_000234 [Bacillariaceae sp.]